MLEPAQLLPLAHRHIAGQLMRARVAAMQEQVERMQAQAGHQDGGHRHQGQRLAATVQPQMQGGALVAAEQALHPLQSDRVHVPGIARQVGHMLQARVMRGMEAVVQEAGGAYYIRSVSMENSQGWLKVSHLPQKQQLLIDIAPSLLPVLQNLLARVRRQFDLEANPATIAQHLSDDNLLAATVQAMPGLRVPGAFDNMELGLRAILGQQVSVAGATTISGRLVARFGTACQSPYPQLSYFFPDANTLANASIDEIASLGMPGRRAATIKHFAEFCQHGGLQLKPGSELADVIHQLKQLPGIGEWTAQYIAMRALRFPNAFPAGDLGLQKAAAKLANGASDRWGESQLSEHSQVWAPWRSYAAMYLWQSLS